jgi:hypothetical protein
MADAKKRTNWAKPEIIDIESAKKAAMYGFWASLIVAVGTAALATICLITKHDIGPLNAWSFIDSIFYAFCAWRIKKMSRTFSVIVFLVYTVDRIMLFKNAGMHAFVAPALIMLLFFFNGIRGTFAYHKFLKPCEKTEKPQNGET